VARSPQDDEQALRWSASVLFEHFFAVQRREGAAARGAGAVPAAVPQPPPQDANGDSPEHVADGVPPLPVADAEVLLQKVAVEDGAASSDEYEDTDFGETNSGTASASDGTGSSGIETEASRSTAGSELVGDGHAGDGGSADELGSPGSERTVEQRVVVGRPQAASLLGAKDGALGDSPSPPRGLHSTSPSTATSSCSSLSPPPRRRRRGAGAAGPARRPSRGAVVGPTPPPTRPLRRRLGAVALRTRSDPWGMQVGEVEQVPPGDNASEDLVAVNRKDLLSPLTMRAIKATADAIIPAPDGAAAMIVKVGSFPLQLEDFHLTMPGQWFNEELVNGYVELLRVRQLRLSSGMNPKPHYIFFNSFFYESLVKKGKYDDTAVQRSTRKEVVLKDMKILIPVNITLTHWFLMVVVPAEARIELYDSLGVGSLSMGKHVARWAREEAAVHGLPVREWSVVRMACRKQENPDDCGVFMCKYMELMFRGEALVGWGGRLEYHRRRIAAELLSGSL